MKNESIIAEAEAVGYELVRGVLGTIEVVESKLKQYYASVPLHVVAVYSKEEKRYVALTTPYTVYTYFCEPDIDDEVEIAIANKEKTIFFVNILERMSSFHEYIAKVLLLFDYKTGELKMSEGHALYAFVRTIPYTDSLPNHNGVDKRWFRRNLYTGKDFLTISPYEITKPTEKSIEFARRKDSETKKQRTQLINIHAGTTKIPFDVRQKVVTKSDRQDDSIISLDW